MMLGSKIQEIGQAQTPAELCGQGIEIGPPLTEFHGILTGVPTFHGDVRTEFDPAA